MAKDTRRRYATSIRAKDKPFMDGLVNAVKAELKAHGYQITETATAVPRLRTNTGNIYDVDLCVRAGNDTVLMKMSYALCGSNIKRIAADDIMFTVYSTDKSIRNDEIIHAVMDLGFDNRVVGEAYDMNATAVSSIIRKQQLARESGNAIYVYVENGDIRCAFGSGSAYGLDASVRHVTEDELPHIFEKYRLGVLTEFRVEDTSK